MNISSNNLYYYLENYNFSTFVVYSIPVEEYNKLLTLINNQNPTDESISKIIESAIPILYHNKENENILVINKDGKVSSYINEWGKLENIDELEMLPIELNNSEKTEKLFTTETLEDIELSFKKYKKINLATITKQHLQKTKVKKINN